MARWEAVGGGGNCCTQGMHAGLAAQVLHVSERPAVGGVSHLVEQGLVVASWVEAGCVACLLAGIIKVCRVRRHEAGQQQASSRARRRRHKHVMVQAPRPQQRGINAVRAGAGGNDHDRGVGGSLDAVEFDEKLGEDAVLRPA